MTPPSKWLLDMGETTLNAKLGIESFSPFQNDLAY